ARSEDGQTWSAFRSQWRVHDHLRSGHMGTGGGAFLRRNEDPRVSRQERGGDRAETGSRRRAIRDFARAVSRSRDRAKGIRDESRAGRGEVVTVFFDIGSTLIDGPSAGPARRLTQMLDLGPEAAGDLEHILFRSPAESAEDLGEK